MAALLRLQHTIAIPLSPVFFLLNPSGVAGLTSNVVLSDWEVAVAAVNPGWIVWVGFAGLRFVDSRESLVARAIPAFPELPALAECACRISRRARPRAKPEPSESLD